MQQDFHSVHQDDAEGNPAGGSIHGTGLQIVWQNGPLGRGSDRKEPNGCFVETVIAAAIDRLEYYQRSQFACEENANALIHLNNALAELNARTNAREARDVEGTHEV